MFIPGSSLFTAFIDFRSAFGSVSRERLWSNLLHITIDRFLLLLMHNLGTNSGIKIGCNVQGHYTNKILTYRGVRQGCILAPLLFNLYINPFMPQLNQSGHHLPKLANGFIAYLLYADDIVFLSQMQIGLRRTLNTVSYCSEEAFEINYNKIKTMIFAKRPKLHTWKINGQNIKQVKSSK